MTSLDAKLMKIKTSNSHARDQLRGSLNVFSPRPGGTLILRNLAAARPGRRNVFEAGARSRPPGRAQRPPFTGPIGLPRRVKESQSLQAFGDAGAWSGSINVRKSR